VSFQIRGVWDDALTLPCSGASPSANCGSQRSTNGWITLAPAARAIENLLSCVRKRVCHLDVVDNGGVAGHSPSSSGMARHSRECSANPFSTTDTNVLDAEALCPQLAQKPTLLYPLDCASFDQLGVPRTVPRCLALHEVRVRKRALLRMVHQPIE
jgi:hypothetical protein